MDIQKLIDLKNSLDSKKFTMSPHPKCFYKLINNNKLSNWKVRCKKRNYILNGEIFTKAVLPFCNPYFMKDNSTLMQVPPFEVIAGEFRRNAASLNEISAIAMMSHLDNAIEKETQEAAHYIQIGDFPYFIASEGKNRVTLYRMYNRKIKALVTKSSYPKSSELKLIKLWPFGLTGLQLLNEELYPELSYLEPLLISKHPKTVILPFPQSVEFFESYGVKYCKLPSFSIKSSHLEKMGRSYTCNSYYAA